MITAGAVAIAPRAGPAFDAAVALFKEHGYTAFTPEHELEFLKVIAMKAPDGHIVVVVYHKREHDED